jgi:hypothetical protein
VQCGVYQKCPENVWDGEVPDKKNFILALANMCSIVYDACMKIENENLEQRLKRAVLECGMSRHKLSKISGVSEAQLSTFINGKRTLTLPVAGKIAEVLGLELRPKKDTR